MPIVPNPITVDAAKAEFKANLQLAEADDPATTLAAAIAAYLASPDKVLDTLRLLEVEVERRFDERVKELAQPLPNPAGPQGATRAVPTTP